MSGKITLMIFSLITVQRSTCDYKLMFGVGMCSDGTGCSHSPLKAHTVYQAFIYFFFFSWIAISHCGMRCLSLPVIALRAEEDSLILANVATWGGVVCISLFTRSIQWTDRHKFAVQHLQICLFLNFEGGKKMGLFFFSSQNTYLLFLCTGKAMSDMNILLWRNVLLFYRFISSKEPMVFGFFLFWVGRNRRMASSFISMEKGRLVCILHSKLENVPPKMWKTRACFCFVFPLTLWKPSD